MTGDRPDEKLLEQPPGDSPRAIAVDCSLA
jgi:hypothetical protein